MKESQAKKIVDEINGILKAKPLTKAVEDSGFERLQQILRTSEWRTIVDEFQIVGGVPYGNARLARKNDIEGSFSKGKIKKG